MKRKVNGFTYYGYNYDREGLYYSVKKTFRFRDIAMLDIRSALMIQPKKKRDAHYFIKDRTYRIEIDGRSIEGWENIKKVLVAYYEQYRLLETVDSL